MVCVPCFIIPVLLFVWRFLQPYVQRFWNPIDQNKEQTNTNTNDKSNSSQEANSNDNLKLPFGITCPTCPIRGPCPKIEEKEQTVKKID